MLERVRTGFLSSTVLSSCQHNAVLVGREKNKKTNIGKCAIVVTYKRSSMDGLPVPHFPRGDW